MARAPDGNFRVSGSGQPRRAAGAPDNAASATTSVVVGLDGYKACQGALQYAVEEADRRDCNLVIVAAYEPPPDPGLQGVAAPEADPAGQARVMVQRCLDLVMPRTSSEIPAYRIMTKAMAPVDALAAAARNAAVIVVGRHHGQPADLTPLGSTTRHLLDHSPIPVISVPRGYRWQR